MATSKAHHDSDGEAIDTQDKEITFYPRGLNIVWGNDNRYWRIPKPEDAKNPDVPAELIQVSWLEVTGSTTLDAGKKYNIKFHLSLKSDAFGWNGCQVYLMAKIGRRGKYKWTKVTLKDQTPSADNKGTPFPAEDFEIEVPESANDQESRKLFFGLYEVWSGKWKGGLQIHKAVVTKK
ncbi:Phloem protein [Trema orientale]|uniref:Phloem protein n=1 Tax=Trema orientale TaxID=63057 RepID=A0A2P5DMD6_TREOI|nr:Phloem protein [Trema orientale]